MSQSIKIKIEHYRKKHFTKELIRGGLITISVGIACFLIFNSLETVFWFGKNTRTIIFLILLLSFIIPFTIFSLRPILGLLKIRNPLPDETVSREIGRLFPEIKDQLTNYLELQRDEKQNRQLISASITQREAGLLPINFSQAIDFRSNKKYGLMAIAIMATLIVGFLMFPQSIWTSTERITHFRKEFVKPAPFEFVFENKTFNAFKNEDYELSVSILGDYIPEDVHLDIPDSRKIKLTREKNSNTFKHTFTNLQESISFRLSAAGFYSDMREIKVLHRPELLNFTLFIDYPAYTGLEDVKQINTGQAIVPQGTKLSWQLNTRNTDSAAISFDGQISQMQQSQAGVFLFEKTIYQKIQYELKLQNSYSENSSPISFNIDVIKDDSPEIAVKFISDTTLYGSVLITGQIKDDYGFQKLILKQKTIPGNQISSKRININKTQLIQNFSEIWVSPNQQKGESFELWLTIYDNDAIYGPKSTESQHFYFKPITQKKKEELVSKSFSKTQSDLEKAEQRSKSLNNKLEDLENRLKSKSEIGWQEEKLAQKVLDEKKNLEKSIQDLKDKYEELMKTQEEFGEKSQSLKEKSEDLNKLLRELLDDETRELYEELQKLLAEQKKADPLNNQLSEINRKEKNLEKELERALELFKKLQRDSKMESVANKLDQLSDRQQKLSENGDKQTEEEQLSEQEALNQDFEEISKDLEEISGLNEELEDGGDITDQQQQQKELSQKLEEMTQQMSSEPKEKTRKKQQEASDQMQEMAQGMRDMQAGMEMQMLSENIKNLEDILDNLIKISFEQERIIHEFRGVVQTDPRFIKLSQDQLQLVENSKVIQDSLISLAKRVAQMSNFITREIDQINHSLDQAFLAIKERSIGKATSHQQFAMTSMNNLALLLDNLLQNMQMALSESSGSQGNKQKEAQSSSPSISELQKQLSQQIQELQQSGKSGRDLSEELARLASEQARIRKELEDLKSKLDGQNPGGEKSGTSQTLKEAIEKMEENETDLVNKRLTQNLINRQKEINTRMLEIEKASKEQEMEEEREAERAQEHARPYPPAFEEYLKARKSEIELLNTIPLDLNPFYKREVNEYFKRLRAQEK
ncbi:DUF4175 family protein [Marinoscillum sp. MHG1-6]|uniref:DUF4175 family protein n=1 Tax=Marinoscillum sp. MHG1-6 TaxID=2959627 RepID=UPI002157CBD3|nr:DUF4175 family protein [Marinoscillum sp. MHG1-6]